jgi:hypothetical protein
MYFSLFGILHQEKSGNPGWQRGFRQLDNKIWIVAKIFANCSRRQVGKSARINIGRKSLLGCQGCQMVYC